MTTENLESAFATARGVLANVKPDQLDNSTPCESWQVRDLINHMIGGSFWFGESVNAGTAPPPQERDFTVGDMVATYDDGIKLTVAAFGSPGAQEKMVTLPFGQFPGAAFMGLATSDVFTHAWDLAKATGQNADLDPKLAAELLAGARVSIPDAFRGPDTKAPFGPAQEAPKNASAADEFAAFMGRKV